LAIRHLDTSAFECSFGAKGAVRQHAPLAGITRLGLGDLAFVVDDRGTLDSAGRLRDQGVETAGSRGMPSYKDYYAFRDPDNVRLEFLHPAARQASQRGLGPPSLEPQPDRSSTGISHTRPLPPQ
jgi:hypothetical protein